MVRNLILFLMLYKRARNILFMFRSVAQNLSQSARKVMFDKVLSSLVNPLRHPSNIFRQLFKRRDFNIVHNYE